MIKVLFVCLGNICRSPMAEAVFQEMVKQAGLGDQISIDSAGTSSYHIGERAHSGTRSILKQNNIQYEGCARQLSRADFSEFDYILAMDSDNLADIRSLQPKNSKAKVDLFLKYAEGVSDLDVPDPYYNNRFADVYHLVMNGSKGLLKAIREEHGL